jgi:gluconokinase
MSVLIVAGVSSSGKTTVGQGVANACRAQFLDADDLHPPANVAKMHAGTPLTDQDREPWLDAIRARIVGAIGADQPLVIAASCLERAHRRHLVADSPPTDVRIAFLIVSFETAFARARHRHHAFFPESLVRSQFETLELPGDDEPNVRHFDGEKSLHELIAEISHLFSSTPSEAS